MNPTTPHQLAAQIKQRARRAGFDLVGIAAAEPSRYREYLRQWLDDGQAGTMDYLARRFEERTDPSVYLPGARSVICLAINYNPPLQPPPPQRGDTASDTPDTAANRPKHGSAGTPNDDTPRRHGRIARYALGDDYHDVLKPRLHELADWIRGQAPHAQTRAAVDTAPVMEKELAARAGVGWLGKNTCVIHPQIGSWLLLGEIITTLDLPADSPAIDRCGTCTRCLDACPTGAITAPYRLDARRCISYLTIEHRGEIADQLKPYLGEWLFGCDICQEVCPWNAQAPLTVEPAFAPRFPTGGLDLDELSHWTQDDYRRHLKRSAMKRVKLPVLQRNARLTRA